MIWSHGFGQLVQQRSTRQLLRLGEMTQNVTIQHHKHHDTALQMFVAIQALQTRDQSLGSSVWQSRTKITQRTRSFKRNLVLRRRRQNLKTSEIKKTNPAPTTTPTLTQLSTKLSRDPTREINVDPSDKDSRRDDLGECGSIEIFLPSLRAISTKPANENLKSYVRKHSKNKTTKPEASSSSTFAPLLFATRVETFCFSS